MSHDIVSLVQNQKDFFCPAVADNAVLWEKESQFAIQLLQANDHLAKVALSNSTSAQNAIINVAAIGISLNPALKHAYLVPRSVKKGGKYVSNVCLDISYMGLLHLAMESGSILWGQARAVRETDTFELTSLGSEPIHKYNPFAKDRGDIIGAYCTVKTANGDFLTETMTIDEIYDIRARSESFKKGYGPWISDLIEMIKKTVVKRANKYWPKVERLSNAIEYLNTVNGEGFEQEPVLRHYSENEIKNLEEEQEGEFISKVNTMIEAITKCQNIEKLKAEFKDAFIFTKGHKIQKDVQAAYNKRKESLNV